MARKKRPSRISKKVYCFIVEGCTEENYLNHLKKLYKKSATIKNCKGGNAKGVMEKAKKIIENDLFSGYLIWFDKDRYFYETDYNLKNSLESKINVEKIFMSDPCIEKWLLAHFEETNFNQLECNFFENRLRDKKYIPNYKKNECILLEKFINKNNIDTAIINYPEIGNIFKKYFKIIQSGGR